MMTCLHAPFDWVDLTTQSPNAAGPAASLHIVHMEPAARQGQDNSTLTFELMLCLFEPATQARKRINMLFSALMRDTGQRTQVQVINEKIQDILTHDTGSYDRTRFATAARQESELVYSITWSADIRNDYDYRSVEEYPSADYMDLATEFGDRTNV